MSDWASVLRQRLETMSVMRQTTLMVAAALVGANMLTLLFYSIFFQERLLLDLLLTSIIVMVVGYPLGFFFIGQNVRLRHMTRKLDRISSIDELTGLATRRHFMRIARRVVRGDVGQGCALLYIDVDHFKRLNDTHGHVAGDQVLTALGSAIAASVPAEGIAARIGGEEFTILLPGADLDEAHGLAEAIRERVGDLSAGAAPEVEPFTISIGVATRQADQNLESLMREADMRLYAAKRAGRDRIVSELAEAA